MELGGIHTSAIRSMRELAMSAFKTFFETQYGDGFKGARLDDSALRHIGGMLDEQCAQAETKARQENGPYGLRMLDILNQKLNELAAHRPRDIFDLTPEILKGFVGLRVADCIIKFSDKPEDDFYD